MSLTPEEMKTVISFILANDPAPHNTLRICLPSKETQYIYNQYDQLDSYYYNAYNDTYTKEIRYEDLCQIIRQLSKELKELPEYISKQYQYSSINKSEVYHASCYVPKEVVDKALNGTQDSLRLAQKIKDLNESLSGLESQVQQNNSFARKIELDVE